MRNRPASDPCYQHPGYIDVLVPPPLCAKNASQDNSEERARLRRPLATTPGYDLEQCDHERWIRIDAAVEPANGLTKNRKRRFCQSAEDCVGNDFEYGDRRQAASWGAFQKYVEKCTPVKIHDVALFRDISPANANQKQPHHGGECDTDENGANVSISDENGTYGSVLSSDIASFASRILDTAVTVQCAFPPISTKNDAGDKRSSLFHLTPQEMDKAISFSNNNTANGSIPTFMGQEDQVTTEMALRDVITWGGGTRTSDECKDNASVMPSALSMAVCVAQEPIVTADEPAGAGQRESSIDNPSGECEKVIQILASGKLKQTTPKNPLKEDTSMAHLSYMLRLPSHLLLGESEKASGGGGDHRNVSIVIHNVNLWYAPQTCRTNAHYDERDNLLLVTEGLKMVELCPPGCIRGSEIYSDHANHPALLRRDERRDEKLRVENDAIETPTASEILLEVQTTRDLKRGRTHVVSVGAGEGLYIPAGWWHRVESLSSTVAVNVWFDYECASRTNVPKHAVPFQRRRSARKHYEKHADSAFDAALERRRQHFITGIRHASDEPKCSTFLKQQWTSLKEMKFSSFISTEQIRPLSDLFTKCWWNLTEEVNSKSVAEDGLIREIVRCIRIEIEYFFLFIDLANPLHVQELVRLWTCFPPLESPSTGAENKLFASLILGLSPETCFIVTQAWERHALSTASGEKESEVESSYKKFFELAGKENEKQVRWYLMDNVEEFRRRTCKSYLMEGILQGNE